ncbi:MAG: 3'-5' exonuclease [Muribaculaceae bacterium]|nr:3'-5' exonuclease [Muribaculaceae bacterium]MDE6008681.1 3'-5' exonuclease [Muribaculaceae bacterium]MDE6793326.1 3'-5' exonuclease [Muribaculaceae bacterium]
MLNFAAIDFETANGNPSSVCSVGVVIVKNGIVVREIYRLIHPVPNYYSPGNIRVHGITKEDTDCEDTFPEVWAEISQYIDGLPLVAHFSRFDEGCLKAAHARFEMRYPDYRFYCTCTASRKHFGRRLPNHRLPTVAKACGYDLESHHHALADAEACAHIWFALTEGRKLPLER